MEEFIAYLVKNLVSSPDQVTISCEEEEGGYRVGIRFADDDVGKVIGRKGNTINALRTICRTVAARLGKRAQVELIQDEAEQKEEAPLEPTPLADESAIAEPLVEEMAEAPEETPAIC